MSHMTDRKTGKTHGLLIVGNFLSANRGTCAICEDLSARLAACGWQVYRTSARQNRLLRLADMIATALSRRNSYHCASINVFSGPSFLWAEVISRVLRLVGRPYVLILRGGGLTDFARQRQRRFIRLLIGAAVVTTPSLYLQRRLAIIWPDIFYLPNGLPVADYPFRQRKQLAPNLVWLRAFHDTYSPLTAVRTIELLCGDFPGIHLTMYGPDMRDGSLLQVRQYIEERGLENHISISGFIQKKQVPEALSRHDLFLNTTRLESFGVCVAEAAACGLPVVTTNVGELSYLWRDEEEALLVPPDDAEAMATAVRRILIDPELAGRLSLNARTKVEQFDWSAVLPKWQALFSSLKEGNVSND